MSRPRVAIMQPYLLPYIGYFQLMRCAEIFVSCDDVQYIRQGWVNRNRLMDKGAPHLFVLPVRHAAQREPIHQRIYADWIDNRGKLLRKIQTLYAKAPQFRPVFALLTHLINEAPDNVARANEFIFQGIARHLGLSCAFLRASDIDPVHQLAGQDRVIALCQRLEACVYVNPIGGLSLYDPKAFRDNGIEIEFLRAQIAPYPQGGGDFVPFLSIVDVLMFNDHAQMQTHLSAYDLGPKAMFAAPG